MAIKNVILILIIIYAMVISYSSVLAKHDQNDYEKFIRPISYDLHLIITGVTELRNYNGLLKFQFVSLTNSSWFKIKTTSSSNITDVRLTNVTNKIEYRRYGYSDGDTSYTFKVNEMDDIIKESEVYELEINFLRDVHNVYADKTVLMNRYIVDNVTKYFAFTRFQAEFLVQVIPFIFEDISFKTPIKLRITHQPQYAALSNMPGRVIPAENDLVTTEFDVTPPMNAHLLAFAVGEFHSKSVPYTKNISFTIHGSTEVLTKCGDAVEISGNILTALENYLQTMYPLPKMDYIIVPKIGDGQEVEHWGLILFEESHIFGDTKMNPTEVLMKNAILNAQLLSRQYFGNLVTPTNWQFYWLTQGFGTFFSYFILNRAYPANNYIDQFIIDNMYRTFQMYSHTDKVNLNPDQMSYWYLTDKLSIHKGSSILRMLQHMVGADTFRAATTRYITRHAYGSTTPDDLIQAFRIILKEDDSWSPEINIGSIINNWLDNSGVPILTITRNYENRDVVLEQNYSGAQDEFKSQKWWIAYNYATKSNPEFANTKPNGWLKQESTITLDLDLPSNEWIIFNKQYTNLYVVHYDEQNWNLLADELLFGNFERIHVFNRAQILNDLHQLVKWGKADRKLLVKSLFYLRQEKSYLPWATANIVLDDFWKRIQYSIKEPSFKHFLRYITGASYDHFRLNTQLNESKGSLVTRTILVKWACRSGYRNCVQDMDDLSVEYLSSLNTTQTLHIHPDLKDDLFCYGFQNEENYNQVFEYFLTHSDHPDESKFFRQFGCKTGTALFRKYYFVGFDLIHIPHVKSDYPAFDKVVPLVRSPFEVKLVDIFYQCLMENCYDFIKHYPRNYPFEVRHRMRFVIWPRVINENDFTSLRLLLNQMQEIYGNATIAEIDRYVDQVKEYLLSYL